MKFRNISAIAMSVAVFAMISTSADARRGGSMGSRGARTHQAPPATTTAPGQTAPVQRTMEKPAPTQANATNARQAPAAPNKMGGLAKGLIGGLIAGGLIGMLMGNGFGGLNGSGILMALLQIAMFAGLIWFALRLFRRRPNLAPAGGPNIAPFTASPFTGNQPGGFAAASQPRYSAPPPPCDFAVSESDKQTFESLLSEVQDAFAGEDYSRLRACTTPEMMSYLAEELSQNATKGQRNEVSDTELLEAEVAEAWSENEADYATIAMQYHSVDVMRDRNTGAVIEGDPTRPSRTTELWTFVRDANTPWRLSAIQET